MHPDGLGTVQATVTVMSGVLTVHLAADNPEAHSALASSLPQLHSELAAGGGQVSVSLHDGGGGQQRGWTGTANQSRVDPRRQRSEPGATGPATSTTREVTGASPSRLIDIRL